MKAVLIVLLSVSGALNLALLVLLAGCCALPPQPVRGETFSRQESEQIRRRTQELARWVTVPEEQIEKESPAELLADIDSTLHNSRIYAGRCLSEAELKVVSAFLYKEKNILETIKEHNSFVQDMKGKKVLILPLERE